MDFYDVVSKRASIREFEDEKISSDVIKRIIDAAYKAPTNDHFRDYEFVVLDDKKVIKEALNGIPKNLSVKDVDDMTFISNPVQKESYRFAVPRQYSMLVDAAFLIIPLMKKKVDILNPKDLSDLNCFATIWCSIENLWLAIVNEGYGCNLRIPRGNEEDIAKSVLGIPDCYMIPCFIGVGKPKDDAYRTKQLDVDTSLQVHFNKY